MTDDDHDLILTQIRNQLTTPLPIGTDQPPRQENPAMSTNEPMSDERLAQIFALKGQARTADEHKLAQAIEELIAENDRMMEMTDRLVSQVLDLSLRLGRDPRPGRSDR